VVQTRDAFDHKVKTEKEAERRQILISTPLPPSSLTLHNSVTSRCYDAVVNRQNGPIVVDGAEKGDVIAVDIERWRRAATTRRHMRDDQAGRARAGHVADGAARRLVAPKSCARYDVDEAGVTEPSCHAAVSAAQRHAELIA